MNIKGLLSVVETSNRNGRSFEIRDSARVVCAKCHNQEDAEELAFRWNRHVVLDQEASSLLAALNLAFSRLSSDCQHGAVEAIRRTIKSANTANIQPK